MTSLPRRQPVRNNSSAVFYQDLVPRHQPLGFDSSAAFSLLHPQRRLLGSTPTSIGPSTSIFGPMLLCEGPSDSNPWRAPSGLGCLAVVSQWLLLGDTPSSLSQVCHRRSHAHGQVTLKTLRLPPPSRPCYSRNSRENRALTWCGYRRRRVTVTKSLPWA